MFTPINKNFIFLFFFFENFGFKISKSFLPIFKKNFPKQTIFFKKKKNGFFQRNKVLVYRGKSFVSLQKNNFFVKNWVSLELYNDEP